MGSYDIEPRGRNHLSSKFRTCPSAKTVEIAAVEAPVDTASETRSTPATTSRYLYRPPVC